MKAAVVMYSKVHGVRKLTSRCSYHEGSASCEIIFIESLLEQCSKKHGNILVGWGGTCNELSWSLATGGSAFPYAPIRQIFWLWHFDTTNHLASTIGDSPGNRRAPADFFVSNLALGWGSLRTLQLWSIWYKILPPTATVPQGKEFWSRSSSLRYKMNAYRS